MAEAIKCNPLDITSNITNGLWTGYWVSSTDNITCNDCILAIIWPSSSDFGLDACVVTVPNGTNIYVCGGGTTSWVRVDTDGILRFGSNISSVFAYIVTSFSS